MRAADHIVEGPTTTRTSSPSSSPRQTCSPRKLAANRANAARSTGPRSDGGKARASMNAVRHGLAARAALLPGEDPAELEQLAAELEADLRPAGAAERELVGRVVSLSWRLRRVARAEEAMWHEDDASRTRGYQVSSELRATFGYPLMPGDATEPPGSLTGPTFVAKQFERRGASALERLATYEQRLDRALHGALRQLQQLRKMRGDADEPVVAPSATTPIHDAIPAVGADPQHDDRPGEELTQQNEPTAVGEPAPGAAIAGPEPASALPPAATPSPHQDDAAATPTQETIRQNEPTAGTPPAPDAPGRGADASIAAAASSGSLG